jgi:hypothetical protein
LHTNGTLQIRSLETRAQDVLRLIPSLRNLLQPVNRLPPEILSCIARSLLLKNNASDTRSIIPLTHVCRYWRNSITSVPANWTLISSLDKDLTALSLERAKAASLRVRLDLDIGDPGFFDLLAPYVQNIGTLRVTSPTTIEKLRQALPKFPQSTPNLRSLSLNSDVHWGQSTDPFGSLASTLRCLGLDDIPLYPSLLRLRSLTEFTYVNGRFDLPLDTLLDFLEENRLLERIILGVKFKEASLLSSRRRTAMENRVRYLSIYYRDIMSGQAIISSIALRRGAHLHITSVIADGRPNDILSGVSTTHLLNLRSPTSIKYRSYPRIIQLFGPNGQFSFQMLFAPGGSDPFIEFPPLPLSHVREFRLIHRLPEGIQRPLGSLVFDQSYFPALETLAVDCVTNVSHLFSALFSNPSSPRSLHTIAFMDCDLTEDFMKELTQYASKRKATTSAWLYKVVIVHRGGVFPSIAAIRKLGEHVPVVDVSLVGTDLPRDCRNVPS